MPSSLSIHHRRSIRLPHYDYSQAGAYFVTMVTYQRAKLFGEIQNSDVILSGEGRIVNSNLLLLPQNFPFLELDSWVIMPDHLHAILIISEPLSPKENILNSKSPTPTKGTQPFSLASVIQNFKSTTSRKIRQAKPTTTPIWHRNYFEHVIRNEHELNLIREYILNNPLQYMAEDAGYGNLFC